MLTLIITRLVLLTGFLCQSNLTVYELIASNADLTVFNSLLATTPEIRKGIASPVFTIFAPTNAAFKELNDTNPEFLKDLQANHGDLVKVFQYHSSWNTTFLPSSLEPRSFISTLQGSPLKVDYNEGVATVGSGFVSATVLGTFQGADGIVAIIDTVLSVPPTPSKVIQMYQVPFFPPTGNFSEYFDSLNYLNSYTIFLPSKKAFGDLQTYLSDNQIIVSNGLATSLMNLHIVPVTMHSTDLLKFPFQKEYPSGWEGLPVTITQNGLGITIAGPGNKVVGRVSSADYVVQGGILHIIDLALVPSLEVMKEEATLLRTINPIFEA